MMVPEYFIDRIENISVQGPVVSLDLGRMVASQTDKKTFTFEKRATITLTGQNFLALVKGLNQTVKAISEKEKTRQAQVETSSKKETSTSQ